MSYIGRNVESKILDEQLNRIVSAFIVLYGRRRVGKTYFIRDYCNKNNLELLDRKSTRLGKECTRGAQEAMRAHLEQVNRVYDNG